MRIEVLPQFTLGSVARIRVGDVLNEAIGDGSFDRFRFAVAYMRMSGLDRITASIDSLLNRGGTVAGAVGIDDGITSLEALRSLQTASGSSTIFYTVSGYIFHPKLYLMSGRASAMAIVGSPNLTRDGLFRNIEVATAVHMDFASSDDLSVYERYDAVVDELLDTGHPNVQLIDERILSTLASSGAVQSEATSKDPDQQITGRGGGRSRRTTPTGLDTLFPPLHVPVAPPGTRPVGISRATSRRVVTPVPTTGSAQVFVMQLSSFDTSHPTGVPGTSEVLIPHAAVSLFPPISKTSRKYADVLFNVVLNTPTGRERHNYRLWYYDVRATGTTIDEYRLRMDKETIDLSTPGGGDLLVINKLPAGSDPAYEVTILPPTDPMYSTFLGYCDQVAAQEKRWGLR